MTKFVVEAECLDAGCKLDAAEQAVHGGTTLVPAKSESWTLNFPPNIPKSGYVNLGDGTSQINVTLSWVDMKIHIKNDLLAKMVDAAGGLVSTATALATPGGNLGDALKDLADKLRAILSDDSRKIVHIWSLPFTVQPAGLHQVAIINTHRPIIDVTTGKRNPFTWNIISETSLDGTDLTELTLNKKGKDSTTENLVIGTVKQMNGGSHTLKNELTLELASESFEKDLAQILRGLGSLVEKAAKLNDTVNTAYKAWLDSVWSTCASDETKRKKKQEIRNQEIKNVVDAAEALFKQAVNSLKKLLSNWDGFLKLDESTYQLSCLSADCAGEIKETWSGEGKKLEKQAKTEEKMKDAAKKTEVKKAVGTVRHVLENTFMEASARVGDTTRLRYINEEEMAAPAEWVAKQFSVMDQALARLERAIETLEPLAIEEAEQAVEQAKEVLLEEPVEIDTDQMETGKPAPRSRSPRKKT